MTIINILEDSNNPTKYLIVTSQDGTSETLVTTNVLVTTSSNNRAELIEITQIPGPKGDKGDIGPIGPAGQNGVVFDLLPVISGGTNNSSFITDKVIYYDGTKLSSSDLDINSIQTNIISNIYAGNGLSKTQVGDTVTLNANLGNGLTIVGENQMGVDTNVVITKSTLDLSDTSFYQGILPINYGGTNSTFFGLNSLVYYDGSKLASYPIPTGQIIHSGQKISVIAGSGLLGGGDITLPNGSVIIKLQNSDDITVFDDRIELSNIISSGTYTKVYVNSKGRIIGGTNLTLNDIIAAVGGTPWTSANDGQGSGLDADLLDGQESSYYRDASNITGVISTNVLPNIVTPGTASKVQFNAKGLIVDSGILQYLDITNALGYVPFDKGGGQILDNVEILGNITAKSGFFTDNTLTLGEPYNTNDIRGIRFRYNDTPAKYAVLAYYPAENIFRISSESPGTSGVLLTLERADSKYVALTGEQQISGIKTFLDNIQLYARLIVRNPTPELPPLDIGTNDKLVQFLNSDLLDNQHGWYYRNAINLTGTLNSNVIIPHIENRGTIYYSNINAPDNGYIEYFPIFHRPYSGHPMVLRSSHVYQTGYNIYMEDVSLSVGMNTLNDSITNSMLIGTLNSGSDIAENSLAVGYRNTISGTNCLALNYRSSAGTNNSIALGKYGETWVDDQISIGGFKNFNVGQDGKAIKDSHAQLSYIPLKYHGEAGGYIDILTFPLPDNKTLEYEAELLFTKQKNTGVASFQITPGIVKNYGYRDPARNYQAFKKAVVVTNHRVIETYNNSQERIYDLNLGLLTNDDNINRSNTLEVTAAPYQYQTLDIQSYGNPIVINPVSDFNTKLKVMRNSSGLDPTYRTNYVIKLEPFDRSPFNTGAPIALGRNINHTTECLYYRPSGSKVGIIKFPNHGLSKQCPFDSSVYIGTGNIKILARTDQIFDFGMSKVRNTGLYIKSFFRENTTGNLIYRTYIDKNIYGTISGTVSFDIYMTSGTTYQNNSIPPVRPTGTTEWNADFPGSHSVYAKTLSFNFQTTNLGLSNKNWSELHNENKALSIVKNNSSDWSTYGLSSNINGYVNSYLGLIEFNLGTSLPLTGPSIYLYTIPPSEVYPSPQDVYFYPDYYLDDTNATINILPYSYIQYIYDNFSYIDSNTLGFQQKQLCYVNNNDMILLSYPTTSKYRINSDIIPSIDNLYLEKNDTIFINDTIDSVTGIYIDNSGHKHYSLTGSYSAGTGYVYLASSISGLGISSSKSFNNTTGTYTYSRSSNSDYSTILDITTHAPLTSAPIIGCVPNEPPYYSPSCSYIVPTGHEFIFTINSGIIPNESDLSWTSFNSNSLIAVSSVILPSGQDTIDLPPLLIPEASIYSSGINAVRCDASIFDFRLDNLRLANTHYNIWYSGYSSAANTGINAIYNNLPAILVSGDINRFYMSVTGTGDCSFSYKVLTQLDSNNQNYLGNTFRAQINNTIPTIDNIGNKIIRCLDWGLLSNPNWYGSVDVSNISDLDFSVSLPLSLDDNFIKVLSTNISSTGVSIIGSGTGYLLPDNTGSWTAYGLSGLNNTYGDIVLYLKARDNYSYTNFSGVLNTGIPSSNSIYNRGLLVTEIYPEIVCNIYSSNGQNTGVFSVSLSNKQDYHTLTVTCPNYLDYFRILSSNKTLDIDNNLNISFNLLNNNNSGIVSGIFLPNTQRNKYIVNKPYSKMYNVSNDTFTVAVLSGYMPSGLPSSGPVVLNIPKIYDLLHTSQIPFYHTESRGSFDFKSANNILSNGLYTIENFDEYDIYLYDFARVFVTGADYGTGIIQYNNIGYNITDEKFSLWGKNFAGDTILHPWRDVPTFISDIAGSCESGRLCIRFSGIPNYFQEKDKFWVDIIPNIYPQSTALVYAHGYYVTGLSGVKDSTVYIKCPSGVHSGIVLGMNTYDTNGFIPLNSYITSFISGEVLKLDNNTFAPAHIYNNVHSSTLNNKYLFSFNRETAAQNNETNILREVWRNFILGSYEIYKDEVAPTVVSILAKIPPFYYNSSNQYYSAWNTTQATRGVNVWRNTGSTGVSMMITGTQNIQTDKNPNFNYSFVNVTPSISFEPSVTGYGLSTNTTYSNIPSNFRFALNDLNKYLCVSANSGLYRPTAGSGRLNSSVVFNSADDWTMNSSKNEIVDLLVKDIDSFKVIGVDVIDQSNIQTSLTSSGNNYICSGLAQSSGLTFRFALDGGIPQHKPEIQIYGLDSIFSHSGTFIYGIPSGNNGLFSYNKIISPFSNIWYINLHVNSLNNINSFSYLFKDILSNKASGTIYNYYPSSPNPRINNATTITYSTGSIPWVMSFDIENVSSGTSIGISGGSGNNVLIISSGLAYNKYLSKWQAYAFGFTTGINTTYSNIPLAITGAINLPYTGNILVTGTNAAYGPRITNITSPIIFRNTGLDPITFYLNYQKTIGELAIPSFQFSNYPSESIISSTKITDQTISAFTQSTNKELWQVTISNVGATGYTLNGIISLNPYVDSFSTNIVSYDPISFNSILVLDSTTFAGRNWEMNLSTVGGGGNSYPPEVQLFDAPSMYGISSSSYNYSLMGWNISLTGNLDTLNRFNMITGIYNMNVKVRDITGSSSGNASLTYKCPAELLNIRKWYAVKDKSYPVNMETSNCCRLRYDSLSDNFTINVNLPTTKTLSYKKYNPLINTYELRYTGDPPTDKWATKIEISNTGNEYNYNIINPNIFTVGVKGLDTDVISVIGLLKMKEIEVISTDYPPLDIVGVLPAEDKTFEASQGDPWALSFGVVGGLSNINFPPTILLSGLPSVCSGYFPDTDPDGPPCLKSIGFNSETLRWNFVFGGDISCNTGLYAISIKAFDSTGEDIAKTNILYSPLPTPGPSVQPELEPALFPNCLPYVGNILISSAVRGLPCPYATGIKGWELIGSLPNGLSFVSNEIADLHPVLQTGVGKLTITGFPTVFPEGNVYPSFIVRATGLDNKTAQAVITMNTASIIPINKNPLALTVYFPSSGYASPTYKQNQNDSAHVQPENQHSYKPYPNTGSMICRSSLSVNNCPTYHTGIYNLPTFSITGYELATSNNQTQFYVTGNYGYIPGYLKVWKNNNELINNTEFTATGSPLITLGVSTSINDEIRWSGISSTGNSISISLGRAYVSSSNVFSVFDYNLSNNKNSIYQLSDISVEEFYDELTQQFYYEYYGKLSNLCNSTLLFSGLNPISGHIQLMPFEVEQLNMPNVFNLAGSPGSTMGCNTCLLGNGQLNGNKLSGKMRPSMIFNITGGYYPQQNYDSTNPCSVGEYGYGGLPNLTLVSGVNIGLLPGFSVGEKEEICLTNCYETGVCYMSGIVLPKPVLEITDAATYVYNSQQVALATRCSFGNNVVDRNKKDNYRELSIKYYIKHLNSGLYWDNDEDTFTSTKKFSSINTSSATSISSISYTAPFLSSGAIYELFMERESDKFPTFNVNSYQYISNYIHWIHRANDPITPASSNTYPGFMPINYGSGLIIQTGVPFYIPAQILGGSGNLQPSISGYLSLANQTEEVLDVNNLSHNLSISTSGAIVTDGLWNIQITGNITGLVNPYLFDYDLRMGISENIASPFPKSTTNIIPVTFTKPLELTITSPGGTTLSVGYSQQWQLSFNVSGGNRPPRYYTNTNQWTIDNEPIIEINGEICNYTIFSKSYNIINNTWSFTLISTSTIISNTVLNLLYIDSLGYSISETINVQVV